MFYTGSLVHQNTYERALLCQLLSKAILEDLLIEIQTKMTNIIYEFLKEGTRFGSFYVKENKYRSTVIQIYYQVERMK